MTVASSIIFVVSYTKQCTNIKVYIFFNQTGKRTHVHTINQTDFTLFPHTQYFCRFFLLFLFCNEFDPPTPELHCICGKASAFPFASLDLKDSSALVTDTHTRAFRRFVTGRTLTARQNPSISRFPQKANGWTALVAENFWSERETCLIRIHNAPLTNDSSFPLHRNVYIIIYVYACMYFSSGERPCVIAAKIQL